MLAFMVGSSTFAERISLINEEDVTVWSISNPIGFIPQGFFEEAFGFV